jgi:signal transduction histidine kinase
VHDYGDVCQAIIQVVADAHAPIAAEDFAILNRCFVDAIAAAVAEYGRAHDQAALDRQLMQGRERMGFFAHELRNMVSTAIMAFEVLKTGNVGVAGNTGGVLHRSLLGLRALIARSLAEVRLGQGLQHPEPFLVSGFIEDLAATAVFEANAREIALVVEPVDGDVAIEADRQVLTAVVGNLLQNACKFTRPHSTVTLRVGGSADRVLIEVEDECGGLPPGDVNELFRSFVRRGADRTGVGLGLAFSRWGAEANHGRLSARDLPARGCIFTLDLPRAAQHAGDRR